MHRRGAQALLFAGLGVSIGLLLMRFIIPRQDLVSDPEEPAQLSSHNRVDSGIDPQPPRPGTASRPRPDDDPRQREQSDALREPSESRGGSPPRRPDAPDAERRASSVASGGLTSETPLAPSEDALGESEASSGAERPLGWCFFSTMNHHFESDSANVWNGERSVVIARDERTNGQSLRVNALWQGFDANAYRGARLELSVHANTAGVASLFVRTATRTELARTNYQLSMTPSAIMHFQLTPAQGWTRLAIVTDVPPDTDLIYFGFANNGAAPLWLDDVNIRRVGSGVSVTRAVPGTTVTLGVDPTAILPTPTNLDFELTNRPPEPDASTTPNPAC